MAWEAVIVELQSGMNAVDFTVTDSLGISKGTLMSAVEPRSAINTGGLNKDGTGATGRDAFAGIANADKEASDGAVNLGLHQTGIFDLRATTGAAITAGQRVVMSGANLVTGMTNPADLSLGYVVGTALEATAAGTAETIEVDIGRR